MFVTQGTETVFYLNKKCLTTTLVMNNELCRLSTYSKFSLNYPVHPLRLAGAGFYYEGNGDEVVCFMCNLKHKAWKKKDDPLDVHKQLSPYCQFIKQHPKFMSLGQQNAQSNTVNNGSQNQTIKSNEGTSDSRINIITGSQQSAISQAESTLTKHQSGTAEASKSAEGGGEIHNTPAFASHSFAETSPGSFNNGVVNPSSAATTETPRTNQSTLLNTGISTARPKYSSYAILSVRESSYRNCPTTFRQQPHELAKAGFFYEGTSDHVRCFFCGGGLKDWEPEDDPWTEHARWFPKCVFVYQCKGSNFVSRVLSGVQDIIQNNHQLVGNLGNNQKEDPAILSVIEMGYKPELVRKIFSSLKRSKGTDHISADLLLQALWDFEDRGIENDVTEDELRENPVGDHDTATCNHLNDQDKLASGITDENHLSGEAESAIHEENRALKEMKSCKICLDEDASIVFLPCGHLVSCASCAPALTKCPICRAHIKGTVKAILT